MAKKSLLLIIIFLLVLGLGAILFFFKNSSPDNPPSPNANGAGNNNSPVTSLVPAVTDFPNAPRGDTFALGTSRGSVTVKNFYQLPVVIDGEYLILKTTNDYQITYNTRNGTFFVYASSSPKLAAQQQGESAFLQLLGISQADACKLSANLSFCAAAGVIQ